MKSNIKIICVVDLKRLLSMKGEDGVHGNIKEGGLEFEDGTVQRSHMKFLL